MAFESKISLLNQIEKRIGSDVSHVWRHVRRNDLPGYGGEWKEADQLPGGHPETFAADYMSDSRNDR